MNAMLEAARQQVIQQYGAEDGESAAEAVSEYLQTAINYEDSPQEKQVSQQRQAKKMAKNQHLFEEFSRMDVDFFTKLSIIEVGGRNYANSI